MFICIAFFIYSICPVAIYGATIVLNILLIVLGFVILLVNIVLFMYIRKIVKCERDKMLGLNVLFLHSKEYTTEYHSNLKEIIGNQEMQFRNPNNNEYENNNENNNN